MTQIELFEPSVTELLIETHARIAIADVRAMAEHARRSIGQRTRLDYFQRKVQRASALRARIGNGDK